MPIAWLMPLILASSPLVALDEHGSLAFTPLDTWLYHAGQVPELMWTSAVTGESNPDLLHEEVLETQLALAREGGFSESGGWRQVLLPHAIEGGVSDDPQAHTGWFATEFRVPEALHGRTVGLFVGDVMASMRIYVNGQLVGGQGRDTPDDFWPGRLTQPGYRLPPALLRHDRPNTVAVYFHAAHVSTALADVTLGDASRFTKLKFWTYEAPLAPMVMLTFTLVYMAAYCLTLYAARRQRVEALFFALGCFGAAVSLWGTWIRAWPFHGVHFVRLFAACMPLNLFFTLFFQRFYAVHYHAGRQRWASFILALWFASVWMLPGVQAMAQLHISIPLVLVAFVYNISILVRALQEDDARAYVPLYGMVILTGASIVQGVRYFMGAQLTGTPLALGLAAFVGATFLTLSRRDTVLEDNVRPADDDGRAELQQKVLAEIAIIAAEVDSVSRSVLASVSEGQRGSVGQSSAVAETKAAMQSLLGSGRNIMQAAQEVLRGAESTQRNNDQVSERLGELTRHSQRIVEILNVIREVANKSDLLALNAALEGVRAGSLGRGFTLVATQMQQLAETIMRQVADIRELTMDIREASLSTESSNNEATRLATDTTRSARQISVFIAEQQSGTEQVSRAMEDIAEVAHNSARHGDLTLQRMQDLIRSADRLRTMVDELHGQPST